MIRGYSAESLFKDVELRVRDVVNYMFCPLKMYLERFLGVKSKETAEASEGRIAHRAYFHATLFTAKCLSSNNIVDGQWLNNVVKEALAREGVDVQAYQHVIERACKLRALNPPLSLDVEFEKHVSSKELGLAGAIDLVEGHIPVELKLRGELREADVVQLTLYALLLEYELKEDVDYGFVDLIKLLSFS